MEIGPSQVSIVRVRVAQINKQKIVLISGAWESVKVK